MKKITLNIGGRQMTFTEEVLASMVEESLKLQQKKAENLYFQSDEWYLVERTNINIKLFEQPREDEAEEKIRQLVVDALEEAEGNDKYAKFELMVPKKKWQAKTLHEMKQVCADENGSLADWICQALAWAQMLSCGVTWKNLCKDIDRSDYCKLIIWRHGYVRLVGGSCKNHEYNPVTHVSEENFYSMMKISNAVPLIKRDAE